MGCPVKSPELMKPLRLGLALALVTAFGYGARVQLLAQTSHAQMRSSPEGEDSQPSDPNRAPGEPIQPVNRLAAEASPYLQLHAHNPVDWYPWGDEAFARANSEAKMIFLSIGYSTCFWCHVMEREVFSNPQIAELMNAHFVSIKVDREERPDVDAIYMQATHLLNGSGGWPNSVFLTPDGEPFYAGTYFPPEDSRGRPGFPRVLRGLQDAWEKDRQQVESTARRVAHRISRMADLRTPGESGPLPSAGELLANAREELAGSYEAQHGGFSTRVKFPRPPALDLLLVAHERKRDPQALAMLIHTLDEMALGGIYDHLAGGFHRYSTEPTWSIPHFEKMLYDNAQLLGVYARAYSLTQRPLYRRVVEETAAYLEREMRHPDGGFTSAQDAEVGGEEGASYVWGRDEIERVIGTSEAKVFLSVYELVPTRENPAFGVLRVRLPVEATLERTGAEDVVALLERFGDERTKLLAERDARPQPLRDDKVLAAWNGLAIRGLVLAAASLDRPDYLRRAERAARFVLGRLLADDGTLRRSYIAGQVREQGVLDDYAFLADGLLALHGATGDPNWLAHARILSDTMLARFEDRTRGGFYLTPEDSELLVRPKPFDDNALPSGNGVALRMLRALATASGEERYREAADRIPEGAAPLLRRAPSALATIVAALNEKPGAGRAVSSGPLRKQTAPASKFRLPRSEDHVRAWLKAAPTDPSRLFVHLAIEKGWHVNANPASLSFLMPVEVEFTAGAAAAQVRYPEGHWFRPEFSRERLRVYSGKLKIPVDLAADSAPPERLAVRFQACDESQCLPPGRAELALEAAGR